MTAAAGAVLALAATLLFGTVAVARRGSLSRLETMAFLVLAVEAILLAVLHLGGRPP